MQHGPCESERGEDNGVAHHVFSGVSVTVETCFSLYLLFAGTASLIRHESCLSSSSLQMVILKTSKILKHCLWNRAWQVREKACHDWRSCGLTASSSALIMGFIITCRWGTLVEARWGTPVGLDTASGPMNLNLLYEPALHFHQSWQGWMRILKQFVSKCPAEGPPAQPHPCAGVGINRIATKKLRIQLKYWTCLPTHPLPQV